MSGVLTGITTGYPTTEQQVVVSACVKAWAWYLYGALMPGNQQLASYLVCVLELIWTA